MRLPLSPMDVQRPILVTYAESLGAVGLCTAVSVWLVPLDQVAAVVSLYLVAIILATLRGGFWPGVVAAVASFLAFDYAFTPPLRTISVPEIADVAAFLIFVGAAGLVSHLVGRAQAEAAEARRRERAARLIADVAQAIGPVEDPQKLDEVVAAWAMRDLPIRGCLVMRPEGSEPPTVRVQMGDCPIPTDAELAHLGRALAEPSAAPTEGARPGVRDLPMRAGDRVVGFVRLAADGASELLDDEPVRVALTHHLGTAVERALLHAEATEAEVLRRSDELKSNLLSLVSHELRTPLTGEHCC